MAYIKSNKPESKINTSVFVVCAEFESEICDAYQV